jgi:hypothetical protein
MQTINVDAFNAIQSSRKSKMKEIVNSLNVQIAQAKAKNAQACEFTARELYNKETAHYYNLALALKDSKEFQALVKDYKFVMNEKKHANFDKIAILLK